MRGAIDEVLDSQLFILGPAVSRFEEQMAAFLACGNAIGVASGSDALLLALMALEIGPGDGVIVTPFTFFSTMSSITRVGATPVLVDIDARGFLTTPEAVSRFIEESCGFDGEQVVENQSGLRIKALLPVHLFGACCAMNEFAALAQRYRVRLIEDVAQACGAGLLVDGKTKYAGSFGDFGCFSFFPSKNLGGYGDGGLVSTRDPELAAKVGMLRMHGESTKYCHELPGINSRLDSIQATVLSVKLRHLSTWCRQRIQRAETYNHLITRAGLLGGGIIAIPEPVWDGSNVFNNYVIRAERRDELKSYLTEQRIQTEIYYPIPLHLQKCFAALGYERGDFPQAELASSQVLALPMYPELSLDQQKTVVDEIAAFFAGQSTVTTR